VTVRRLFWLVLGAVLGVLAVRKVSRTAAALGPQGLSDSLSEAAGSLRDLADAVRDGMAEREADLRVALGIDAGTLPEPGAPGAAAGAPGTASAQHLLDHPAAPRQTPGGLGRTA
jgi:hypothetical protein